MWTALRSCAIVCDRDRRNRTMFYSCDRLRSSAIECDHLWTKFCDHAIGMCPTMLWFPSVQQCKRHDTMTTNCLSPLMEGETDTKQLMEEITKYDCLFNRFSKEFKDKFKKINASSSWPVGEVFSISPAAAEKKFRNVRTAYGRYLKRRKSVPSGSNGDPVPIPREFISLEWLSEHIELNGKSRTRLSLITAIRCDHMWTCYARSLVQWFQQSCDHLRLYVNQAFPWEWCHDDETSAFNVISMIFCTKTSVQSFSENTLLGLCCH